MSVDLRNFVLNTNYSLDQIVAKDTATVVMPGSSSTYSMIYEYYSQYDHDMLVRGFYNGTEIGLYHYTDMLTVDYSAYIMGPTSDGKGIKISMNNNTQNSITFNFVFYFSLPPTFDGNFTPTIEPSDNFLFNTNKMYQHIYDQGNYDGSSITITHNLGYYPYCELWYKQGLFWVPANYNNVSMVTTTKTQATFSGTSVNPSLWRIFGNGK